MPEVRGTADTDGGAYSPFRLIHLVHSHDFFIIQILRTDVQWRNMNGKNDADAGCAPL